MTLATLLLLATLALAPAPVAATQVASCPHRSSSYHYQPHRSHRAPRRYKRRSSVRAAFQRAHPCPSTGKRSGACPGYVVDHRRALKHGGADAVWNMQWQSKAAAKAKDRWE